MVLNYFIIHNLIYLILLNNYVGNQYFVIDVEALFIFLNYLFINNKFIYLYYFGIYRNIFV
jgi:hypothetical protein